MDDNNQNWKNPDEQTEKHNQRISIYDGLIGIQNTDIYRTYFDEDEILLDVDDNYLSSKRVSKKRMMETNNELNFMKLFDLDSLSDDSEFIDPNDKSTCPTSKRYMSQKIQSEIGLNKFSMINIENKLNDIEIGNNNNIGMQIGNNNNIGMQIIIIIILECK